VVDWQFTALLLSNGVLIGLMYSLIALGFVLVYKATDAINFAQGEFVMISGFVAAGCLMVWGTPLWLAVALALGGMIILGFALERVMLRRLIGRPVIAVVIATIAPTHFDVARRALEVRGDRGRGGHDVGVGHHHALRQAGSTRRVHDVGHVVGSDRDLDLARVGAGDLAVPTENPVGRSVGRHDGA